MKSKYYNLSDALKLMNSTFTIAPRSGYRSVTVKRIIESSNLDVITIRRTKKGVTYEKNQEKR